MKKTRRLMICLLALAMTAAVMSGCGQNGSTEESAVKSNLLTSSVVWKQTAAEYEALYFQAFNLAKSKIDQALESGSQKPLAIITDVDDTICWHNAYWGRMVQDGLEFFNDEIWDEYIIDNGLTAAPGAVDLLNYCEEKGVEVFYVTNRYQGENTYEVATENLKKLGFPYVDTDHLFVQIDTSDKETVQKEIAAKYEVVVYMGDSLNDFQRKYYVTDVDERRALMEEDQALYGEKYIILPNPTDGHWIRAVFGESEPADTAENRQTWNKAAQTYVWK